MLLQRELWIWRERILHVDCGKCPIWVVSNEVSSFEQSWHAAVDNFIGTHTEQNPESLLAGRDPLFQRSCWVDAAIDSEALLSASPCRETNSLQSKDKIYRNWLLDRSWCFYADERAHRRTDKVSCFSVHSCSERSRNDCVNNREGSFRNGL